MPRNNGGVNGKLNSITASASTGIWTLKEQYQNVSSWPAAALYAFTSMTFGTPSRGQTGPSLSTLLTSYYDTVTYPWLNNTAYFNMVVNGIQEWTVPISGTYTIRAAGGAGHWGSATAGTCQGIIIETTGIVLTRGEVLRIIAAGKGSFNTSGGGGGGTFIWRKASGTSGLIMAAGGGGGGLSSSVTVNAQTNGQSGTQGGFSTDGAAGTPGTNGGGGTGANGGWGGGGAGWLSNGTDATQLAGTKGYCWSDATYPAYGGGSAMQAVGGFGGGGGTHGNTGGGGGGGGYSGGAGGGQNTSGSAGGGGGSYSVGTISVIGYNTGVGYVTVTKT